MKKAYQQPAVTIGAGVMGEDIAQSIGTGSGDQLGKERKDDFGETQEKDETWANGLW